MMAAVLKYVEVTGLAFKAQLEDGRIIAVSALPKSKRPRKCLMAKPGKTRTLKANKQVSV